MGWLRHQKRRWRTAAAVRKKRRLETARERDRGQGSNPQPASRGASFLRAPSQNPMCIASMRSYHGKKGPR